MIASEGDPLIGNQMIAVEARGGGFELGAEFVHAIGDVAAEGDAAEGVFSESIAHVEEGDEAFRLFEHSAGEDSDAAGGEVSGEAGDLGMADLADEDEFDGSGVGGAFALAQAAFGASFVGFEKGDEALRNLGIGFFLVGAAHVESFHAEVQRFGLTTVRCYF